MGQIQPTECLEIGECNQKLFCFPPNMLFCPSLLALLFILYQQILTSLSLKISVLLTPLSSISISIDQVLLILYLIN